MIWGSAVSSPSGVWGRAPASVAFCCIVCWQNSAFLVLRTALQWVTKWKPIQAQLSSNFKSGILQLTKRRPPEIGGPVRPNISDMPVGCSIIPKQTIGALLVGLLTSWKCAITKLSNFIIHVAVYSKNVLNPGRSRLKSRSRALQFCYYVPRKCGTVEISSPSLLGCR